jgi:hypothetical protein
MSIRHLVLSAVLTACAGGSAAVLPNADIANRQLTGSWDVSMSLDRAYQLDLKDPPARQVCGTIGFVEANQRFDGGNQSAGVYDIDLARIGLDWVEDSKFPAAIARGVDQRGGVHSENPDSVVITLNPYSEERILLTGLYRVAGIDGMWTAQSSRGTASGRFTLRPHASGRQSTC